MTSFGKCVADCGRLVGQGNARGRAIVSRFDVTLIGDRPTSLVRLLDGLNVDRQHSNDYSLGNDGFNTLCYACLTASHTIYPLILDDVSGLILTHSQPPATYLGSTCYVLL